MMNKTLKAIILAGIMLATLSFFYYYAIFLPQKNRVKMEQEKQEQLAKEQAKIEQEKQEQLVKEQAKIEQEKQKQLAKEQAKKKQAKQDQLAKEQARIEQENQEQLAKEQAILEQEKQEQLAKEQARIEQERKDQLAEEQAILEQEKRDQLAGKEVMIKKQRQEQLSEEGMEGGTKEKSDRSARIQSTLLDLCLENADKAYWNYVVLNGKAEEDGTVWALPSVWYKAERNRKKARKECYKLFPPKQ